MGTDEFCLGSGKAGEKRDLHWTWRDEQSCREWSPKARGTKQGVTVIGRPRGDEVLVAGTEGSGQRTKDHIGSGELTVKRAEVTCLDHFLISPFVWWELGEVR